MSVESLEKELAAIEKRLEPAQQKHAEMVAESKAKISALQDERDRLLAEIEAARITEGMSDVQRAALAQALRPNGIQSGEAVGTPGR